MLPDVSFQTNPSRATMAGILAGIWPDDPERRLLATVISNALNDVMNGTPRWSADARRYLKSENFTTDCEWLAIDPRRIHALLTRYEEEMSQVIPPEDLIRLHARYMTGDGTLKQLAQECGLSAATLSRLFSRAGLPTRRRGGPKPSSDKPMIVSVTPLENNESPVEAVRELHAMLRDIGGRVRGSVQIRIDLEVQL